ncbi:raffinose/stachyose/melibiose transport system permease protein [Anaerocolumna jejuensis DSM 15929]|jgi:raffinose/stachyose/melibiose transport system permease protein|uniref:Raffinose/stachyose/melibiose transport system permease protein n=1 Tax=Anaerocolumna jejuensis DSM 15929 TaxID=1121322 RepID=A0A1M6RQV2_9FIRM|nr:carbohydrate ABC transporter permease [Anaerocolumna jejuensis]SHK34835.1 raffinose/stachyose/melibiose transport system permease protein [Anaerocolumna jejuensis DSM 15929]
MGKELKTAAASLGKIAMALVFLAPFYIAVVYAVKSPEEKARTGLAFPTGIHWENFTEAIRVSNFWNATKNSLIVTVFSVALLMIACSMAAYVIARNMHSRFYQCIYYIFLGAILLSFQVVMLPLYVQLKGTGMLNSRLGLILTISGFQLAYNVFVYVGFIRSIPIQMEEAAFIDGAGRLRTFWSIVFPLLKPIVSSTLILNALAVWNDFQISLIIAQKEAVRTIPLTQYFFFGQYSIKLNMAFAAFVLAMIPIIILYLVMQRYIISGVMAGAVKG